MNLIKKIIAWFRLHRVCAWCKSSLGGNPMARKTHTICPQCQRKMKLQMVKVVCAELNEPETPFIVKSL